VSHLRAFIAVAGGIVVLGACTGSEPTAVDDGPDRSNDEPSVFCNVSTDDIFAILGPDAIPSLTDPPLVAADHEDAGYLEDTDRIIGVLMGDDAIALPHNIMYWHENVNLDRGGSSLAVTFCPLTGTALAFDRSVIDGRELGVSGLLFRNNLVLYDRGVAEAERSFFPQMLRTGACGPLARQGLELPMVASWEMRWDAWKALYPETLVISERTGFARNYRVNPNIRYEEPDNTGTLFPIQHDPRRPPKERVLGIPIGGDGGPALPFGELDRWQRAAVSIGDKVVFWDRDAQAALPFDPVVNGEELTFQSNLDGFTDNETGSTWRLDGLATDGPMAGERLTPLAEAYVAFWFAWADFHRATWVWFGS
jgi:hypothetical protein